MAQLRAFRNKNYREAMQYQTGNLSSHFATMGSFQKMMEVQYPAFLHFRSAAFGRAEAWGGGRAIFVPVTLTQPSGLAVNATYELLRQGTSFKIEGVAGGVMPPVPLAGARKKPNSP